MSKLWKDYFSLESMNLDKTVNMKDKIQKLMKSHKVIVSEIFNNVLSNREFQFD